MPRRIALFGGSFHPPGLHHRLIAQELARHFDETLVIPCGPRPDKPDYTNVSSICRAALCDITFEGIPNVRVDLFDLEQDTFTPNIGLQKRYEALGELWHVIGADWLQGGAQGESVIQKYWANGHELWKTGRFIVLTRPDHPFLKQDLPPHHVILNLQIPGSSTEIRNILLHGDSAAHLLTPRANRYISRYGLYRGNIPATWARGSLQNWQPQLFVDRRNNKATTWAKRISKLYPSQENSDFIISLGGDGTMLRSIREYWRKRLPFLGINAGTLGFLMNAPEVLKQQDFPPQEVIFRQLPLLHVELDFLDGSTTQMYAFNDAWIERSSSQSAWLEVQVNDVTRIQKLVSDGILVSTAAGSTAYARSMGASPLLADTPAWLLVGSNVQEPAQWKSALLSTDSQVTVANLHPEKRPVQAYVDGVALGPVTRMRARMSRAACVELVFLANHDMAEKIAAIQFRS